MNVEEWIESYGRAWRDRDADAASALFTEGTVYRSHPFREPHLGTQGVHDYWSQATEKQEEIELRFGTPIVAGDRAAVEWWAQMISGGEEVTLPGILYLRFADDGRCEELREAWHAEPGRRPPYDGWGL